MQFKHGFPNASRALPFRIRKSVRRGHYDISSGELPQEDPLDRLRKPFKKIWIWSCEKLR